MKCDDLLTTLQQRLLNCQAIEANYEVIGEQPVNDGFINVRYEGSLQINYSTKTANLMLDLKDSDEIIRKNFIFENAARTTYKTLGFPISLTSRSRILYAPSDYDQEFEEDGLMFPIAMSGMVPIYDCLSQGCCQEYTISPENATQIIGYLDSKFQLCQINEELYNFEGYIEFIDSLGVKLRTNLISKIRIYELKKRAKV